MISRRKFLGATTGAAASLLAIKGPAPARLPGPGTNPAVCGLMDLSENCLQRESFAGYRKALAGLGAEAVALTPAVLRHCRMIIVPATVTLNETFARNISDALRGGACVLLESAAGFGEGKKFDTARRTLLKHWGIIVETPINLRAGERGQGCVPYVDLTWPIRVKVRDFSRVVPVGSCEDEAIAQVSSLHVGLKRKVGPGTLIFLGSLVGPALGAGDREARGWLREVLRSAEAES